MRQDMVALIAMGKCLYCRKNKADEGYRSCLQCRMDRRLRKYTPSDESKERKKERLRRRRDLLYAFGVCITCGKHDAAEGSHTCGICLCKAREKRAQKRRKAGIAPRDSYTKEGICFFCDKPVVTGKKTCERHYEVLKKSILHARNLRKK